MVHFNLRDFRKFNNQVIINQTSILCILSALVDLFIKLYIMAVDYLPFCGIVQPVAFCDISISHHDTLACLHVKLCPLVSGDMCICINDKHSQVVHFWFLPMSHFKWCLFKALMGFLFSSKLLSRWTHHKISYKPFQIKFGLNAQWHHFVEAFWAPLICG